MFIYCSAIVLLAKTTIKTTASTTPRKTPTTHHTTKTTHHGPKHKTTTHKPGPHKTTTHKPGPHNTTTHNPHSHTTHKPPSPGRYTILISEQTKYKYVSDTDQLYLHSMMWTDMEYPWFNQLFLVEWILWRSYMVDPNDAIKNLRFHLEYSKLSPHYSWSDNSDMS